MPWFLKSFGDHDTHRGKAVLPDGRVVSACGVTFHPMPRPFGNPPALPGDPPDPAQTCPQCRDGKPANRRAVR